MADEVHRVGIPGKEGIDVGTLYRTGEEIVEVPVGEWGKRSGLISSLRVHLDHLIDLGIGSQHCRECLLCLVCQMLVHPTTTHKKRELPF